MKAFSVRTLLIALFLASSWAYAQLSTGTIAGTVTDTSGAVIPGGEVRISNTGTGLVLTLATDSAGLYRVPNLPPGGYKVDVSFTGFQAQSKVSLVLSVDQTLTVDFQLTPGQHKESVTVMARAEQLREQAKHLSVQHHGQSLGAVTVSIGVAGYPRHGLTSDMLLQAADRALYRAKALGRNQVAMAEVIRENLETQLLLQLPYVTRQEAAPVSADLMEECRMPEEML